MAFKFYLIFSIISFLGLIICHATEDDDHINNNYKDLDAMPR